MAELAPSLLLTPVAGVFADRYSRATSNYSGTDFPPGLALLHTVAQWFANPTCFNWSGRDTGVGHELCTAFTDGADLFNGTSPAPDIRYFTQRNHLQPGKISWAHTGRSGARMAESNHSIGL